MGRWASAQEMQGLVVSEPPGAASMGTGGRGTGLSCLTSALTWQWCVLLGLSPHPSLGWGHEQWRGSGLPWAPGALVSVEPAPWVMLSLPVCRLRVLRELFQQPLPDPQNRGAQQGSTCVSVCSWRVSARVSVHMCVHECRYECTCVCVSAPMLPMHVCVCACGSAHVSVSAHVLPMRVCMSARDCTCLCAQVPESVCVCVCPCKCGCAPVCVCVCA